MSITQTAAPQSTDSTSTAHGASIYIALVPWVLFSAIAHVSVQGASILALIASAVIAAPAVRAGRPKILELAAVVTFAGFSAVVLALDPSAAHDLARYARGIAAGILAIVAFGSLLFTPFTEQYARERVPATFWNTQQFKQGNRQLTVVWGCAFAAMVPLHVIAGTIDTTRGNVIFNWVLPLLLVSWAVKRSNAAGEEA